MKNKFKKIAYFVSALFIAIIFITDLLLFYSNLNITLISVTKELLIVIVVFLFFWSVRSQIELTKLPLNKKLLRFSYLIFANYIFAFILERIFHPQYTPDFPSQYLSVSAILVSTILSILAIVTLIPIIFIVRELIFYKQKRWTGILFNGFLILTFITALAVAFTKNPLNMEFSRETFFSDILFSITLTFAVMLAFRNEWITYLPRKEKMIYFFAGTIVFGAIANIFDMVFQKYLTAYSLFIAAVANILWIFLVIYGGIAIGKLFIYLPTAKAFDRKLKEVSSLYGFARTLNSQLDYERLLKLITQLTARVLESHSTWLAIRENSLEKLSLASHLNLKPEELQSNPLLGLQNPLNQEIVNKKQAVIYQDVHHHQNLKPIIQWKANLRSLIAAPLFSNRGQLMGILYASKDQPYGFDVEDVSLLQGFANQAAIALENAKLLKESIERERLEQELKIAREVQLKLLPQEIPKISGFQVDSFSITAYEVGGDYYDFFNFADGTPGVIIGDVSGKGTSAAFYMAEFKGVIQTLAKTKTDPKEILCQANAIFYSNIDRRSFVSATIGKLNPKSRVFEVARAGHTPLIYCSAHHSKPQSIISPGIGIGLEKGLLFEKIIQPKKIRLQEGDTLLLYTDGLTEARDAKGEEFGEERLYELLNSCKSLSAEEIKETIMEKVTTFVNNTPLHDDLTIIVIKYVGKEENKVEEV